MRISWIKKGIWAILDHGLFASSNLFVHVLLARWLSATDYGAFVVVYTVFLLLGTFHSAIITEPMMVFGSGKYHDCLSRYLSTLLYGHWAVTILTSGLLIMIGGVSWVAGGYVLSLTFLALALSSPCILYLWMMRKACYVVSKSYHAAYAGGMYMVLMMLGIYALYISSRLSPHWAIVAMGVGSMASAIWLRFRLTVPFTLPDWVKSREILASHWQYGTWSTGTGVMLWLPANVYYFILPLWGGMEASAALRALQNLLMPVPHMNIAVSTALLPTFVRKQKGNHFGGFILQCLFLLLTLSVLYWLSISILGEPLMNFLYDQKYTEYAEYLWIMGLASVFASVIAVLGPVLRAIERPDHLFWSYGASTTVVMTAGIGATFFWGLIGTVIIMPLAMSVASIGVVAFCWRYFHSQAQNREATNTLNEESMTSQIDLEQGSLALNPEDLKEDILYGHTRN